MDTVLSNEIDNIDIVFGIGDVTGDVSGDINGVSKDDLALFLRNVKICCSITVKSNLKGSDNAKLIFVFGSLSTIVG